jgi:parvulin-like peptidyl-prolyl isomerase
MHWRGPLASALVGFSLAALGCECEEMCPDACDVGLLRAIEAAGRGEPGEVRAQAPDGEPTVVAYRPAAGPPAVQTAGYTAVRVVATVNGEAILEEELRAVTYEALRRLDGVPEPERSKRQGEILSQALNGLIEREVVVQDALERLGHGGPKNVEKIWDIVHKDFEKSWLAPIKAQFKIKSDDEFKAFLKTQGVSFDMAKRQWERQRMMEMYLQNQIFHIVDKMGHLELVEYYEQHPEEFKVEDKVEWQDLFVAASRHASREAARRFAESLAQRVRQGEDFAKLSEQFDDGDGKLRRGESLVQKPGEIRPPEAEPLLLSLKDNDVVLWEQPPGFHVVRLVKRQHAGTMPFDEKTQKLIKDKLRMEILQRESKRLVTELKRKAVIEVYK